MTVLFTKLFADFCFLKSTYCFHYAFSCFVCKCSMLCWCRPTARFQYVGLLIA